MCNKTLFQKAHALTKKTVKKGDSYSVTFGLCLKQVIAESATVTTVTVNSNGITTTTKKDYKKTVKKSINNAVAMVGDYTVPNDNESHFQKIDYFSMIISVIGIIFIYGLTMLAITQG